MQISLSASVFSSSTKYLHDKCSSIEKLFREPALDKHVSACGQVWATLSLHNATWETTKNLQDRGYLRPIYQLHLSWEQHIIKTKTHTVCLLNANNVRGTCFLLFPIETTFGCGQGGCTRGT
jgi:hypothetical protein